MTPHYTDDAVTLYHGDCLDVLRELPDASVDAVVTDPPYGLEFMGKEWDRFATGRAAKYAKGGDLNTEAMAAQSGKGGAGPTYVSRPAKRCATCGRQEWSGSPCVCPEPTWVLDNSPLHSFQAWCEQWAAECLRVLKPGGHLLAFGGTRTWHRLTCAVEDAGFEIRDSIAWLYASGFPKSLNVNKAAPDLFCQCEPVPYSHDGDGGLRGVRNVVPDAGVLAEEDDGADLFAPVQRGTAGSGVGAARPQGAEGADTGELHGSGPARPGEPCVERRGDAQATARELQGRAVRPLPAGVPVDGASGRLRHGAPAGDGAVGRALPDARRDGEPHQPRPLGQPAGEPGSLADERGSQAGRGRTLCGRCSKPSAVGLGTALKPAHEPIVVARKPLAGSVAANVLTHGTGAINVDGCRVAMNDAERIIVDSRSGAGRSSEGWGTLGNRDKGERYTSSPAGRWPANVVLDSESAAELDRQSGISTSSGGAGAASRGGMGKNVYGKYSDDGSPIANAGGLGDTGGASRFFPTFRYEPKAPTVERPRDGETAHPTVKPLDLMRWLVRLVTPPGGVVLEPFAGSGTTAEACVIEGFRCIAIEREPSYLPLIVARLSKPIQPDLFGGAA